METMKSAAINVAQAKTPKAQPKGVDIWFNKQAKKFEESRFGWMTAYMTIQSCVGSIAAAYLLQNHASDIMLAICAVLTMAANAVFIAQGPAKWCLSIFYMSVVINSSLIFFNL
jgi:hypothetical protein